MKKSLLISLISLLSFLVVAQDTTRIYINPGHGGWGSDDRYIALPPYGKVASNLDTLAFWESSSNLDKGLILYNMLDSLNQIPNEGGWKFMISRVLNREEDDRNLSEIVEESNAFNSNFMLSIHSNAGNPANYPLMLYSGVDEGDNLDGYYHKVTEVNNAEGRAVSKMIGDNIYSVELVPWTNAMQLRGDKTFARDVMGWSNGYGVLRNLTTPGLISEGRMHDYAPETYRLMNHEYRWLEAWHFLHAFVHYYKGRTLKTGNIAGDVRDKFISILNVEAFKPVDEGGKSKYYCKDTRDAYYPLNGADVKLIKGGDTIRTYKTDQYFNSFWLFGNLEPGNYEVEISKEGYHTKKQEVVVKADQTSYLKFDMLPVCNTAPEVIAFSPANNDVDSIACNTSIIIDWNWCMHTELTEAAISIEPAIEGTFTWKNFGKRLIFTPTHPFVGNTLYTIRIATTAAHPDTSNVNTLQTEYVSKFLTKSYDTLKQLAVSPKEGDVVSISDMSVLALFDTELNSSKTIDCIYIIDEKGNKIDKASRKQKWNNAGEYGSYQFELSETLLPGKTYKLIIDEFAQNVDGITIREKKEIPFIAVKYVEPILPKKLDCSNVAFIYDANVSEGVKSAKVTVESKEVLFSKMNKLTYSFANDEAVVEYDLATPIEVKNGLEFAMPMKGDCSHNNLKLKYISEDSADSLYADFVLLDNINWKVYNFMVEGLSMNDKKWYLSAIVVEKTGHPANVFEGEIFIENIYEGKYLPSDIDRVVGVNTSVWPNPVTDFIYIDAPKDAIIDIYSIEGRLISSNLPIEYLSTENFTRQISTTGLVSGVYVVNVVTKEGLQTFKFIKE